MPLNVFNTGIDPIINDGALLTALLAIIGAVVTLIYKALNKDILSLKNRVNRIEESITEHAVDIKVIREEIKGGFAVVKEQIDDVKKQLEPINNVLNRLLEKQLLK